MVTESAGGGVHLTVLSPEQSILERDVYSVTVPGAQGYFGVLKGHAPLISSMVPGKLTAKDASGKAAVYAVGAGFVEVSHNRVIILADSIQPADGINAAEAATARDAAQKRLTQPLSPAQRAEAESDLAEAKNLLNVRRNPGPSV